MADVSLNSVSTIDLKERERTYHRFVTGITLFAVHVVVILILLALFFL
jgi:hypothetical protein